jgi:hypothetical protein
MKTSTTTTSGLRVKTGVKAGGLSVKSGLKAGGFSMFNHNVRLARA